VDKWLGELMSELGSVMNVKGSKYTTKTKSTTTSSSTVQQTGRNNISVQQTNGAIKITINGKTYHTKGQRVNIANRDIIIDGVKFIPDQENENENLDTSTGQLVIKIEADTKVDIETHEALTINGNITGNVTCGSLDSNDIKGDVKADGPVNCGDIKGNVDANGPVNCGDIEGNLKASGPVNCGDVGSMT